MPKQLLTLFILLLLSGGICHAQNIDSTLDNLQQLPTKYINGIDKKITQYTNRISSKTEKTLTKLSRWENKIKGLLQKASPETADRLFGNNQLTFTSLLQKLQQGEALALQYQATYNKYRDDITTSLNYLSQQKQQLDSGIIKKATATHTKMKELATEEDRNEAIQQFIKERKKELIAQAIQYIGKSKYLSKINKEAYYYAETLKNYKELFTDSKKAEQTAKTILNKIPAFQQFMQKNSMLAGLFDITAQSAQILPGMQTRNSVQQLIQGRLATMGGNAQNTMNSNLQAAQSRLNEIKTRLNSGNSSGEMPDFKPKTEKVKLFKQRIEYGTNIQFSKSNNLFPSGTDIALSIGYKSSSRSTIGLAGSYKMGIGSIRQIHFSNQGAGVRSFIDWHLKRQIFISGGFEMNYLAWTAAQLQAYTAQRFSSGNAWQQSAVIGVMKKISIKTKWFKSTNVQVLYDFLSNQHIPATQPILFKTGYSF